MKRLDLKEGDRVWITDIRSNDMFYPVHNFLLNKEATVHNIDNSNYLHDGEYYCINLNMKEGFSYSNTVWKDHVCFARVALTNKNPYKKIEIEKIEEQTIGSYLKKLLND